MILKRLTSRGPRFLMRDSNLYIFTYIAFYQQYSALCHHKNHICKQQKKTAAAELLDIETVAKADIWPKCSGLWLTDLSEWWARSVPHVCLWFWATAGPELSQDSTRSVEMSVPRLAQLFFFLLSKGGISIKRSNCTVHSSYKQLAFPWHFASCNDNLDHEKASSWKAHRRGWTIRTVCLRVTCLPHARANSKHSCRCARTCGFLGC